MKFIIMPERCYTAAHTCRYTAAHTCRLVRAILIHHGEYFEPFTNAERVCRAVVNEHQRALLECVELVAVHNVSWDEQPRDDRVCCGKRPALPTRVV